MNDEDYVYFGYNADGIRTSKTLMGEYTEKYLLDGDKVVEIYITGYSKEGRYVITYDESGNPFSFEYYSSATDTTPDKYYYVFNLQGDVIQLRTADGTIVANYTYDAWGKQVSVTGTNFIANRNPIRYRGYFYDTETGLYYCNSRYYDPEVKRFINADAYMSTGQGFLGHNMFAYCQNNPVMFCDPSGFAITEWDLANLSSDELYELTILTNEWNSITDESYREFLHAKAVSIREKHLGNEEYVMADGNIGSGWFFFSYQITRNGKEIQYKMCRTQIVLDVSQPNMALLLEYSGYVGLAESMLINYVATFGHMLYGRSVYGIAAEIDAHIIGYNDTFAERFRIANLEGQQFSGEKNYMWSEFLRSGELVYYGFMIKEFLGV